MATRNPGKTHQLRERQVVELKPLFSKASAPFFRCFFFSLGFLNHQALSFDGTSHSLVGVFGLFVRVTLGSSEGAGDSLFS